MFPAAPVSDRPYPLSAFADIAAFALGRVGETWPEARIDFERFVRLIVHVPDGAFRSCSAARYAGVIFLTADDKTLLDLEESLIHEYGHQVLYNVMLLDPLFEPPVPDHFALPWSGAERDFYGYFHAFYIYTLLAHYYDLVLTGGSTRTEAERERARERRAEIVSGLVRARGELGSIGRFTPAGRALFARLTADVEGFAKWAHS